MKRTTVTASDSRRAVSLWLTLLISAGSGLVYFFSNPKPQNFYDYTFRVAENLLAGRIGLIEKPPAWLNEFVPLDGVYYSVFPLGSVLTMIPFAAAKSAGLITEMPGAFIAALIAAASALFLLLTAESYELSATRIILMPLAILFGTWMWTNLTMPGAWQLALGFAFVGELGAIYFTLFDRRPALAGAFFALGFGNRTEVLLTAPIFFYLLRGGRSRREKHAPEELLRADDTTAEKAGDEPRVNDKGRPYPMLKAAFPDLARFCIVPFFLGTATLLSCLKTLPPA